MNSVTVNRPIGDVEKLLVSKFQNTKLQIQVLLPNFEITRRRLFLWDFTPRATGRIEGSERQAVIGWNSRLSARVYWEQILGFVFIAFWSCGICYAAIVDRNWSRLWLLLTALGMVVFMRWFYQKLIQSFDTELKGIFESFEHADL